MYKFSDNKQNNWAIDLNIGGVIDVQETLGYNLLDPSSLVDGVPLPAKIMTDDLTLANVVYVLIKEQLEKNNVDKKQFFNSLDAQAIKTMSEAFSSEYRAFFMSRGRHAVAKGLEEMEKVAKQMYDTVLEQSSSKSEEADSQSPNAED